MGGRVFPFRTSYLWNKLLVLVSDSDSTVFKSTLQTLNSAQLAIAVCASPSSPVDCWHCWVMNFPCCSKKVTYLTYLYQKFCFFSHQPKYLKYYLRKTIQSEPEFSNLDFCPFCKINDVKWHFNHISNVAWGMPLSHLLNIIVYQFTNLLCPLFCFMTTFLCSWLSSNC